MINEENETETKNDGNLLDLDDLFKRTYEFDILKYVSRGLIKSQQNYELTLKELKSENSKIKEEISLLKKEIDILKDNKNQYISRNKIEYDNIKNDVKNLTDDVGKIKQKNKNFESNIHNQKSFTDINFYKHEQLNKNINRLKRNISHNNRDKNKLIDEKEIENSNDSMVQLTNTYINELVNENKIKDKNIKENQIINNLNNDNINNELLSIKSKLEGMNDEFNQFKLLINQMISESNNNITSNISDNISKLKEESKKELDELKDTINQKIILLNDSTKNKLLTKLEIINTKNSEYMTKTDFEKYKDSLLNQLEEDNRDVNIDISLVKKSINSMKNDLYNLVNDTKDHDTLLILKQKQESTNGILEQLKQIINELKEADKKKVHIDTSNFIDIETFNEYQKKQIKIIEKIKRENMDIERELTELKSVDLASKTNLKDLKNLEDKILVAFDDSLGKIKETFVEKKYLDKYFRIIEYQTKQTLDEFKLSLKPGNNWLLAKKPIGHLCASCESFLGNRLQSPDEKHITLNKYISRASGDNKNIKINGGFSKIIQMLNNNEKENEKYISLPTSRDNILKGRNNSSKRKNRIEDNEEISTNINISNNTSRINKINFENNNSFQAEEFETDILNGSLPRIRRRKMNENTFDSKGILKRKIKSLKDMKNYKEIEDKSDYIIKANSILEQKNDFILGAKITKIKKKINNNNESQLNNESKKNNNE